MRKFDPNVEKRAPARDQPGGARRAANPGGTHGRGPKNGARLGGVEEDRELDFEELLAEMMGMLDQHVVVAVGAYALTGLPEVSYRPGPEGFEEVTEGEAVWTMYPVVEVGGKLRRGAPSGDDPDGVVFIVGQESPGRFARVHLSPSSVVNVRWIEDERLHGGGQLVIGTQNANMVIVHRVDFQDEGPGDSG